MFLKACLNGSRTPAEHPSLPVTASQIAAEAAGAVVAGADAVHVHPKDADGADTMDPVTVAAVLDAVRSAVPGTPVGVTTGAWIGNAADRIAQAKRWTVRPDFASVNWHEPGATRLAEVLLESGIGVEAGLHRPSAVSEWLAWRHRQRTLRILLEVVADLPADQGRAAAGELVRALGDRAGRGPVLLHGEQGSCWPVLTYAIARGFDTRIGLEDTLTLPDGRITSGNAELVRAARAIEAGQRQRWPPSDPARA